MKPEIKVNCIENAKYEKCCGFCFTCPTRIKKAEEALMRKIKEAIPKTIESNRVSHEGHCTFWTGSNRFTLEDILQTLDISNLREDGSEDEVYHKLDELVKDGTLIEAKYTVTVYRKGKKHD